MDIRRRNIGASIKGTTGGGSSSSGTYTINLNGQWEKTTAVSNPDSILYDGVYRSASNYNVSGGVATMYINITNCSTFKVYIRSYAESNYDYVMVSQLDQTIDGNTSYSNTTLVKAHTRGNQQSGTAISSYTLVEFTGMSLGDHTITIIYRKDGSVNSNDDRGYVLIPKGQGGTNEEGGDVDIDITSSIEYTSTDGNIVSPSSTSGVSNNIYSNGVGVIAFDKKLNTIYTRMFYNALSLQTIIIPDGVTSIEYMAFYGCSSLTSATMPDDITSIGDSAFYNCSSLTDITIPNNVTSIATNAFYGCSSLPSVILPDGVTKIGDYAFYNCSSTTNVIIPDSVTDLGHKAFYGCTGEATINCNTTNNSSSAYGKFVGSKFTKVIIGNGVTSIGNYAFYDCDSLTSVTIPDSVTSIGNGAFYNCSLTSLTISNKITSIGDSAFSGNNIVNITVPASVTNIGLYAFGNCTGELVLNSSLLGLWGGAFSKLVIGDNITAIPNDFSKNNSTLTDVTISNSVTTIGSYAFAQNSNLVNVNIPDSVTSVGGFAFGGCDKLPIINGARYADTILVKAIDTNCSIKNGTRFIGADAFRKSSITSISIPNGVISIGSQAFYNCTRLQQVTLPDGMRSIGRNGFYYCSSLKSITIPSSIISIGLDAFNFSYLASVNITDLSAWCRIDFYGRNANPLHSSDSTLYVNGVATYDIEVPRDITVIKDYTFNYGGLKNILLHDSITSIGNYAFYYTKKLQSVTIPASISNIGEYAFSNSTNLSSVFIKAVIPPTGGSYMFNNCSSDLVIYVPSSSVNAYKSASGWSSYADKIVGYVF